MNREKLKKISEKAIYLYFLGMSAKEAIAKAREVYNYDTNASA